MEDKDAIVACMQTMVTQMAYCVKEMEKKSGLKSCC